MKKIFLLLFFPIFFGITNAQITLDKSYNGILKPIILDFSGEKFYMLNTENQSIEFYNFDNSLWKTVILPVEVGSSELSINLISETILESSEIEIIFSYIGPDSQKKIKLIDDIGNVYYSVSGAESIDYMQTSENNKRLIIQYDNTHSVKSEIVKLTDFQVEQSYTDGNIKTAFLENLGNYYYLVNNVTNQVKIYNLQNQLYLTYNFMFDSDLYELTDVLSITQTYFFPDNAVEFMYKVRLKTEPFNSFIIVENENGNMPTVIENAVSLKTYSLGCSGVRHVATISDPSVVPARISSKIYSMANMQYEYSYPAIAKFINFVNCGGRFYYLDTLENKIVLYSATHKFYKNVNVPSKPGYKIKTISHMSDMTLNNDTTFEFVIIYEQIVNKAITEMVFMNELGSVYLESSDVQNAQILNLTGENKMLVYSQNTTNLYTIPFGSLSNNFDISNNLNIFPNPVKNKLIINDVQAIENIIVTDLSGRILINIGNLLEKKSIQIDFQQFSPGVYIVNIQRKGMKNLISKVIKN